VTGKPGQLHPFIPANGARDEPGSSSPAGGSGSEPTAAQCCQGQGMYEPELPRGASGRGDLPVLPSLGQQLTAPSGPFSDTAREHDQAFQEPPGCLSWGRRISQVRFQNFSFL